MSILDGFPSPFADGPEPEEEDFCPDCDEILEDCICDEDEDDEETDD